MANPEQIREFLTTRRAKITPERAGLPTFGRHRRVAGLRREEVALVAGISVEYYTRLERGNARGVSDDVLDAVSRALQLDDSERAHLLDLVRTANEERGSRRTTAAQRVRPSIARVVDAISDVAAFGFDDPGLHGRADHGDPDDDRAAARGAHPRRPAEAVVGHHIRLRHAAKLIGLATPSGRHPLRGSRRSGRSPA